MPHNLATDLVVLSLVVKSVPLCVSITGVMAHLPHVHSMQNDGVVLLELSDYSVVLLLVVLGVQED